MNYKEQLNKSNEEIEKLRVMLNAKEQVISILYNLIKDIIFWNKTK